MPSTATLIPPHPSRMIIQKEDPTASDVMVLLTEHVQDMRASTPAAGWRVLDLTALRQPSVTFYTTRNKDEEPQGCCAIKELSPEHGEVKRMRTSASHLRKGIARNMTQFLISEGRSRGMKKLSLETGAGDRWAPARLMYEGCGFEAGAPYGDYGPDGGSLFMTLNL